MAGYMTYWSKEHLRDLEKAKDNGPIQVIYGSRHTKMPTIKGVREGDIIYPVTLIGGQLYAMGRMPVEKIEPAYEYLFREVGELHGCLRPKDTEWNSEKIEDIPHKRHQLPQTCCAELAASSVSGSLIKQRMIPEDKLMELRFGSTKSKQKGLKLNKNGMLTTMSLSGFVRKMSDETWELFESLFAGE